MDKRKTQKKHVSKTRLERSKLVLLALMALLLAAPTLATVFGLAKAIPDITIDENRTRLERPALDAAEAFSGTGEYFQQWDRYYNDGFGTRDLFIRIKNQLNYTLFRYNSELFFDDNGYMYYYNVVSNQLINNERLEDFTPILDSHAELAEFCDARDIKYVFFYPPQKNTVYQPDLPVKRPTPVTLERFYTACENDPRLEGHFVNVIETLRAQEIPVFYKTDFHWNDYGAALAYGDVINHLAALEGIAPPFVNDLALSEFTMGGLNGNQLNSLSILTPIYETAPTVQKASPITSSGPDWSIPTMTVWTNQAEAPLGTALIIGDSYTPPALYDLNGTSSGIIDYFKKVYFVNYNEDEPGLLHMLPDKIDYVIFEAIEVGLASTADVIEPLTAEPAGPAEVQ